MPRRIKKVENVKMNLRQELELQRTTQTKQIGLQQSLSNVSSETNIDIAFHCYMSQIKFCGFQ